MAAATKTRLLSASTCSKAVLMEQIERMKSAVFTALLFFTISVASTSAQDTFSIVAVDITTGQVGSAGATCLDDDDIAGGAIIISDVVPDHGAIHTQSYWHPANQSNAHEQFIGGASPTQLMDWLVSNDVQDSPGIRQYGAVDLVTGSARADAFTGEACMDYHGHLVGEDYAIQGNILLDASILEAMEQGFTETSGTLAERLMAALQGANVPGADSRCLEEGVSSRSAFIRVAFPGDDPNNLTLDLNVSITPEGVEPITELQGVFDAWNQSTETSEVGKSNELQVYLDSAGRLAFSYSGVESGVPEQLLLTSMLGQEGAYNVSRFWVDQAGLSGWVDIRGFSPGTYIVRLVSKSGKLLGTRKMMIH